MNLILTNKEEKLILRSRKIWYKIFHTSRSLLAIVAVALIATLMIMVFANIQERQDYEQQIEQLAELAQRDSIPAQFISATKFETPYDLLQSFITPYFVLLDSLELTDKVIGVVLYQDNRPTGVEGFRYGISRLDVFTSCGCDQQGYFALHLLEVDPTLMSAKVVTSYEAITLAEYNILNRHSLFDN